jgi:hypothetical protein
MIDSTNTAQSSALAPLTYAWLGLVLLTLFGLGVGQWFRGVGWQPLLVAAIVWVKSWLVAGTLSSRIWRIRSLPRSCGRLSCLRRLR